jgi:hypothetical protein
MEEKEATAKDSIESLLASILRSKHGGRGNTGFVREPIEIYASPEEGAHLMRAFIRIKQPRFRAAIIKLATQIADGKAFATPTQN